MHCAGQHIQCSASLKGGSNAPGGGGASTAGVWALWSQRIGLQRVAHPYILPMKLCLEQLWWPSREHARAGSLPPRALPPPQRAGGAAQDRPIAQRRCILASSLLPELVSGRPRAAGPAYLSSVTGAAPAAARQAPGWPAWRRGTGIEAGGAAAATRAAAAAAAAAAASGAAAAAAAAAITAADGAAEGAEAATTMAATTAAAEEEVVAGAITRTSRRGAAGAGVATGAAEVRRPDGCGGLPAAGWRGAELGVWWKAFFKVQRAAAGQLCQPVPLPPPHLGARSTLRCPAGGRGRGRYSGPGDRSAAAQREPAPTDLEFVAELKGHTRKVRRCGIWNGAARARLPRLCNSLGHVEWAARSVNVQGSVLLLLLLLGRHTARLQLHSTPGQSFINQTRCPQVTSVLMDEGSGQLFTGSFDGTVRVWSCTTGEVSRQWAGTAGQRRRQVGASRA